MIKNDKNSIKIEIISYSSNYKKKNKNKRFKNLSLIVSLNTIEPF